MMISRRSLRERPTRRTLATPRVRLAGGGRNPTLFTRATTTACHGASRRRGSCPAPGLETRRGIPFCAPFRRSGSSAYPRWTLSAVRCRLGLPATSRPRTTTWTCTARAWPARRISRPGSTPFGLMSPRWGFPLRSFSIAWTGPRTAECGCLIWWGISRNWPRKASASGLWKRSTRGRRRTSRKSGASTRIRPTHWVLCSQW
mmetsp:Transcript_25290/g.64875  ORF Transcript_25290/g.64875 Transcript_25290/m.64875 type:complete len:202 (-) Transcript_25290:935-1540(-)